MQVETVLLAVHSGTVTLAPVPEEEDEALREAMMEELDVGAVTPVPRERSSGHSMVDPLTRVSLFIPVPDFRQMAYVSMDDMVADAWISPAVVELKLPVGIANIRNRRAAGFQIVARERTTDNAYRVPSPSN